MNSPAEKLSSSQEACIIRFATRADVSIVVHFIHELAAYEKLSHEAVITEDVLLRTMFGPRPYAEALLAEEDGKAVGFALFFHNFSTFLGKPGLYLEDLFILPEYRQKSIGMSLLRALAKIALERDCGRMEWWVLDWNESAIKFYREKLGAKPMDEWTVQRLDRTAIEKLAKS